MCLGRCRHYARVLMPLSRTALLSYPFRSPAHLSFLPSPPLPLVQSSSCPTGADSVLVGMWHDLPETPRQEEQLRRAKVAAEAASDAKSIVLRNMRHEICTPMHAPNSPRWRGEARQEQSKIDSQRPSALPRASRTFGSALSLKRSMYLQPETYRHAQEDKAPGTCIKEGPSGRAIRGCWVAGLLGCWEANSTGMLRQIIPHRVSNVIEFTHTVVTHQLLRCTPHVLLLLLHYSSILQTGPPARQGFQGTIMQIYPLCNNLKPLLRRLKSRLLCNNLKPLLSAEEKTSRGAKKQWSPSIVLANTSHKIRMV
ncbi:unnamed protein product, partial [Closterium sp. NIES-64]